MNGLLIALPFLFIIDVAYSQNGCSKAIKQAKADFKKSIYCFHSEELLPVENTYLYVLSEYYKISWEFVDPSPYYDCYDSTMNVLLKKKFGNNYNDRAHTIADSLEKLPSWRRNASYPGGTAEVYKFFEKRLIPLLSGNRKSGSLFLEIEINEQGKVTDAHVFRGFDKTIDKKIVKLSKEMPLWNRAYLYGKPIRMNFILRLRIEGENIAPPPINPNEQ